MENIMKIVIVLVAALFLGSPVLAADPFFDEDFKQYEDEYKAGLDACWKLKSNRERNACDKSFDKKMAGDARKRGSETYFDLHYKSLNYDDLEEKFLELKALHKKAQGFDPLKMERRPHGVVGKGVIMAELGFINQLQAERELAAHCEEQKRLTESLQFSMSSLPSVCKQYFAEKKIEERLKRQGVE